MRRTKEDAEKTRIKLLEAATEVFNERGYYKASMEEISKYANLTRGAIVWHFSNKENLFRTVIDEVVIEVMNSISQIFNENTDPLECIKSFVNYVINERFKKHEQVGILSKLLGDKPTEFQEQIEKVRKTIRFIVSQIQNMIKLGQQQKLFKADLDVAFTSHMLFTFFWGFYIDFETLYSSYTEDELKEKVIHNFMILLIK
jgi:TetR/AcrR family acrAB operon transcriptional repressor